MRCRPIALWTTGGLALLVGCYRGPDGVDAATEATTAATDDTIGSASVASSPTSASASASGAEAGPGSAADASSASAADSAAEADTGDGSTAMGDSSGPSSADGSDMTADDGSSSGGMGVSECTAPELELIDLVNAYRADNGLPAIPASPSLCVVGHTHAVDLATNAPHAQPGCNLHSWSDAGAWTPCCYTADHAQAECMWMKPTELTVYPGTGYENAAGGGGAITPQQALELWQNSAGHNAVILNQGIWADLSWGALGAGIDQGYAVLWFGEEADPGA